jgi:hypothetical protein
MKTEGQAREQMTGAATALIGVPHSLLAADERAVLWDMLKCAQAAYYREDFVGAVMWASGVHRIINDAAARANA